MSKLLAVMIAGLFAAGAYAQNPAGATSEQQPVLNTKAQNKAESKVDARPQGMVKNPMGDEANNSEVNPVANGKAANAAQSKVNAKPQGMVKKPMGDEANNSEVNPVSNGKAANAGQAKIATRNAKAMAKKNAATN